jgi:hypothetical protein
MKVILSEKETTIIDNIPEATEAKKIWSRFADRRVAAKEDRIALGSELHKVRQKLAKKGCGGLFTNWLRSIGLNHDRAYGYMAVAGHGKRKTDGPCYVRKLSFLRFQTRLTLAETKAEKRVILKELTAWVREEFQF